VAHKFVIGVIRTYWLRCDALNDTMPATRRTAPEQLVLGWLLESGDDDLGAFLAQLPYWPIGQDAGGDWV
jgi:hypothetical protein